jgi:hypothetical protein
MSTPSENVATYKLLQEMDGLVQTRLSSDQTLSPSQRERIAFCTCCMLLLKVAFHQKRSIDYTIGFLKKIHPTILQGLGD